MKTRHLLIAAMLLVACSKDEQPLRSVTLRAACTNCTVRWSLGDRSGEVSDSLEVLPVLRFDVPHGTPYAISATCRPVNGVVQGPLPRVYVTVDRYPTAWSDWDEAKVNTDSVAELSGVVPEVP